MPVEKKKTEVEETEETEEVEETEETEETDNWAKMEALIDAGIAKGMTKWQSEQEAKAKKSKTTSSSSPRKAAPPKRKAGFLSTGFFSGLTDEQE